MNGGNLARDGYMQSEWKAGQRLVRRQGIYGGPLNRRRRASTEKLVEWIKSYQKMVEQSDFCPKRAEKIISHFKKCLDRNLKRKT